MARRELSSQKKIFVSSRSFCLATIRNGCPHCMKSLMVLLSSPLNCWNLKLRVEVELNSIPTQLIYMHRYQTCFRKRISFQLCCHFGHLAAKFQGVYRSISGHIYSSSSFEPKSSRCRGGNAIRSPPRFVRARWWMWISKDQTLPSGRIGNPFSMDHPKDQPLCSVDWPSRALLFYFIIPQDAELKQNVAYHSGSHPKPIESMVLYGISTYIYPKDQPYVGKYTMHRCYGKWYHCPLHHPHPPEITELSVAR